MSLIDLEKRVTCNFCGNPDPIYYCNKCNTVFCSKCKREELKKLALCGSCGATIAEIYNDEIDPDIKYRCYKCRSKKYVIGQKRRKYCPGCNKSDIITIAEKKKNLIATSRNLIFTLRDGYKEFDKFLKNFERIKSKLVDLRTSGFFHDPNIEKILLKLIKFIPIIKNQIIFRVEQDHRILKGPLHTLLRINLPLLSVTVFLIG